MEPEELHRWYLEATSKLRKESFNKEAQKPYNELTEEQKYIDKYISDKIKRKVKEMIIKRKLEWKSAEPITALLVGQTFDNLLEELGLED